MADAASVVNIRENTPEQIAYRLMNDVLCFENRAPVDRKYLLDAYAECLSAVRGQRPKP